MVFFTKPRFKIILFPVIVSACLHGGALAFAINLAKQEVEVSKSHQIDVVFNTPDDILTNAEEIPASSALEMPVGERPTQSTAYEVPQPSLEVATAAIPIPIDPVIPALNTPASKLPPDNTVSLQQKAIRKEIKQKLARQRTEKAKVAKLRPAKEQRQADRERLGERTANVKSERDIKQSNIKIGSGRASTRRRIAENADYGQTEQKTSNDQALVSAYKTIVSSHLVRFKRYPDSARSRGAQGAPAVTFTIGSSGSVTGALLARSSGNLDLDAEVVAMARRASPFPLPPAGATRNFTVSVRFALN